MKDSRTLLNHPSPYVACAIDKSARNPALKASLEVSISFHCTHCVFAWDTSVRRINLPFYRSFVYRTALK